ncbi:hypothetical protein ACJJTC_005824 [Scirpophaga incertulas]
MNNKNTFESFEYLPSNSNENSDQFFVVQDGTILVNNRHVQYVTDMQDAKQTLEPAQPCEIYDVTPQQYLVEVNNSSQLISVQDQFIVPDSATNDFSSNYLTKTESNLSTEQAPNMPIEYKANEPTSNLDVVDESNKQMDCTEITLTDKQYHMLEEKGWILLDVGDKVYLLDTLGLHDITSNSKLIHKLQTESYEYFNQPYRALKSERNMSDMEIVTQTLPNNFPNFEIKTNAPVQNETPEENIETKDKKDMNFFKNIQHHMCANGDDDEEAMDVTETVNSTENKINDTMQIDDSHNATKVLVIDNSDIIREGNTLKIKTKLSLVNFPDKIVLGKTKKGKQLVARVVRHKSRIQEDVNIKKHESDSSEKITIERDRIRKLEKNTALSFGNLLNESDFLELIKYFLQNDIPKCSADDITSADSVIAQLLQIPAFKTTVEGSNLIVTKTIQNDDPSGNSSNKHFVAVVTGKVTPVKNQLRFNHLPYLLQNMNDTGHDIENSNKDVNKRIFDVLHIHILETKQTATNIVKVSVTVMKRGIPITMISNIEKQQVNTTYACSVCAAVFENELLVKLHQENSCKDHDTLIPKPQIIEW